MARSMAIRVVLMSLLAALLAFARPADAADLAVETNRPVATSDLRVIVRSTGYVDALRKHAAERLEPQPIVRPLAGDLWLVCVVDLPRQINMLTDRDLEKLGLSQEMNGQLVVAVPVPEGILYAEGKDRASLDALTRVAEATAKGDQRRISTQLLRWVPEGWEVVNP